MRKNSSAKNLYSIAYSSGQPLYCKIEISNSCLKVGGGIYVVNVYGPFTFWWAVSWYIYLSYKKIGSFTYYSENQVHLTCLAFNMSCVC